MGWKVYDNNGALLVNLDNQFANGPISKLSQIGIIANPGGGIANATQLNAIYNFVDTVATDDDSVKLLPAKKNTIMVVSNRGVSDLNVFPFPGDLFFGQSASTAYQFPLTNGAAISVLCTNDGTWALIP